jgi:hypothetical protein
VQADEAQIMLKGMCMSEDIEQSGPDEKGNTKKKQIRNRQAKKQQGAEGLDTETAKPRRTTREDKGIPRLEERDFIVLRWTLQMYAVRFDQLQRLLARHSPKQEELADPEHVSPSTVRTHLRRWKALGLVRYTKILAAKEDPLWCWLTPYGLRFLSFEEDENGDAIFYTYYEPREGDLKHMFLINQARLYIEQSYPDYSFKSERQLRREQSARPKAIKQRHLTDGLFYRPDGRPIALEVERWDKSGVRLEAILTELAETYHRTWYFVSKKANTAVRKAHTKLPDGAQQRIQILSSEVKLLGFPPAKEIEPGELSEE